MRGERFTKITTPPLIYLSTSPHLTLPHLSHPSAIQFFILPLPFVASALALAGVEVDFFWCVLAGCRMSNVRWRRASLLAWCHALIAFTYGALRHSRCTRDGFDTGVCTLYNFNMYLANLTHGCYGGNTQSSFHFCVMVITLLSGPVAVGEGIMVKVATVIALERNPMTTCVMFTSA